MEAARESSPTFHATPRLPTTTSSFSTPRPSHADEQALSRLKHHHCAPVTRSNRQQPRRPRAAGALPRPVSEPWPPLEGLGEEADARGITRRGNSWRVRYATRDLPAGRAVLRQAGRRGQVAPAASAVPEHRPPPIPCGTAGGGYICRVRKDHQMCQSGCPNAPAN